MALPLGHTTEIELHDEFHFKAFDHLQYEEVILQFKKVCTYHETENLGYEFEVLYQGKNAGTLTALINNVFEAYPPNGNVGLKLDDAFLNLNIPYKTAKAIAPLFKFHDHDDITVAFDKNKKAIEQACIDLAGEYLDTVEDDSGHANVRYIIKL